MSSKGVLDHALARVLALFPDISRWWAERTATVRTGGPVPWTPFTKRFAESRAALLTTGGFHLETQAPFDCDQGDPSYREIPSHVDLSSLRITHTHYDTRDATRDPNILFPLDRLRELVEERVLGSIAQTHYSLMGYIPQIATLVDRTAEAIADGLNRESVDLVLLTPA